MAAERECELQGDREGCARFHTQLLAFGYPEREGWIWGWGPGRQRFPKLWDPLVVCELRSKQTPR